MKQEAEVIKGSSGIPRSPCAADVDDEAARRFQYPVYLCRERGKPVDVVAWSAFPYSFLK